MDQPWRRVIFQVKATRCDMSLMPFSSAIEGPRCRWNVWPRDKQSRTTWSKAVSNPASTYLHEWTSAFGNSCIDRVIFWSSMHSTPCDRRQDIRNRPASAFQRARWHRRPRQETTSETQAGISDNQTSCFSWIVRLSESCSSPRWMGIIAKVSIIYSIY